ncbi:methyltransferase domain-containing protein [Paenibacillus sp. Marseille-Q4541]|uniref:class I SAM-dependent methyltransferase n=1 Tax=Paenibacillus sp. Marseille-Q4541 TaxID=2831522 RepID=UPI001BAD59CC|nr:methyltransferase domain-containing protein [Paenibacillus sp. Marseille-Q4541]
MNHISRDRASMPEGTSVILNQRTLETSNRRLAELLQPGMSVLDVGCGSGAITRGIAEQVGFEGTVTGIDVSERLINEAIESSKHLDHLDFYVADIYGLPYQNTYDVVTAARVLQWLSEPMKALDQMVDAAKQGGMVLVLDYNHEKIEWSPEPPEAFSFFYKAFLKWRQDSGMSNELADSLISCFKRAGLQDLRESEQHEHTVRGDLDFDSRITIWADVAASRGKQMVSDGYVTEQERMDAENSYRTWAEQEATEMKMYLLAIEGTKPSET